MKRQIALLLSISLLLLPLLCFAGCGSVDYTQYISDCRSDIFLASTDELEITVSCLEREYPFAQDGFVGTLSRTVEVTLAEKNLSDTVVEVYFLEDVPRGGEMSFRSVTGDWYYSRGVENFPEKTLSLRIVRDGKSEDIAATSVKNEKSLSPSAALDFALGAERETVSKLSSRGVFSGELHVRLLRRDKNYYYIGVVDRNKHTVCMLLDSETGKVLARREKLD